MVSTRLGRFGPTVSRFAFRGVRRPATATAERALLRADHANPDQRFQNVRAQPANERFRAGLRKPPPAPLPLRDFEQRIADLPRTTEAERLTVQRIGQDIFRDRLMDYWQGRCPLTWISDPALLRASHIIPWSECESDAERLDVHSGLLLSALWDAAFDRALVTLDDQGRPEYSSRLTEQARAELRWSSSVALTDEHRRRLARHGERAQ